MKRNNLVGRRFGMLTVVDDAGNDARGNSMWLCRCDCGNTKTVRGSKLMDGQVKSCGCTQHIFTEERRANISKSKITHGLSGTRLYYVYDNMLKRCYDAKSDRYQNYGARGITVCDEWLKDRRSFFEWAISSGYAEGLTIDRIDVNGNYCPDNCRWATAKEQANNRTSNHTLTYRGETHSIAEWAERFNIPTNALYKRISGCWDVEAALTTPV